MKIFSCTLLFALYFLLANHVLAQTDTAYNSKLTAVYTAPDKKKALEVAKELFALVEKKQELQTYANYYILKTIFENQAPDATLANTCKEKAEKALNALIGTTPTDTKLAGTDANSVWLNDYYTNLFTTTDPTHAEKALKFLNKNPSIHNFNNYNYVAYAFERNGDFDKARENYERALKLIKDDKQEFVSYSFYTNFLSRSGEYLKAETYLDKMQKLSEQSIDVLQKSYLSEALTCKAIYYLAIGDYFAYLQAANLQHAFFSKNIANYNGCDPYSQGKFTFTAYAKEMLKIYPEASLYWQKRDSSHFAWIECNNKKYPNNKQYPLSMLPVYQLKTGFHNKLQKPVAHYIKEAEEHFNSYKAYADVNINFLKANQLGFLGGNAYHQEFTSLLAHIQNTRDFRQSTLPFTSYAYFNMRDRDLNKSKDTYDQLFKLNADWINDIIFSFGEKAFVAYYNTKLSEGYENYHSLVKIAKEQKSPLYHSVSQQAFNNLLFTKSLSLKGTQRRKKAFLKANDPATIKLYEEWLASKQQLIRLFKKSEDDQLQSVKEADQLQLKTLQEKVNHLENELTAKGKDFKKYLKIEPQNWKSVRDKLKEGEAAIEMIRFQWRDQIYYSDTNFYAAYIITKSSQFPEVVYLPDAAKDLDGKYYKYYQNNIKLKQLDKQSYKHYWQPIKEALKGIKKVYFSPDGIFHLINLSTINNPESGQYLLDEIDIHYTTSTIEATNHSREKDIKSAFLIGRPAYKVGTANNQAIAMGNETDRSFVRTFRNNTVADLPGTEEEVKRIKLAMEKQGIQVSLHIKEEATEDKLYKLHSPDIVHIATHGYWSEINYAATDGYRTFNAMVNSGLLLSGVVNYYNSDEYPDTYDGIMTAYEAQNLDLENTSLVILSACETSLGHFDAGEGVYGLQRAFRAAGAESIMTSLWKVDDDATKEFMILFYENYLKSKDKFSAFRTAQQQLKEKYPQPYFWGAFVLTGI